MQKKCLKNEKCLKENNNSHNKPTQIKINIKCRLAGKLWRSKSFITTIIVIWNDNLPFTPHYHCTLHLVYFYPLSSALCYSIASYTHNICTYSNNILLFALLVRWKLFFIGSVFVLCAITIKFNLISFRIASYEVNVSQDINRILW